MANGRMINHAITKDRRVNQLSDDTSRLAFTWLITFADREGRTYGDPAIVRSMLFPRREDISIARMTEYIQEWHDLGLVVWYEAQGDQFIFFPAFDKNQPGMRKERESASIIPPPLGIDDNPTPDELRSNDGVTPELSRIKLKEIKLKEKKGIESAAGAGPDTNDKSGDIYRSFENNITQITLVLSEKIDGWINDYPHDWILDAISEGVTHNGRSFAYVDAILKKWQTSGRNGVKPSKHIPTLEEQGYKRVGE